MTSPDEAPSTPMPEAASPSDDPIRAPRDPNEGAVPPGYDWPTHGGYLGCLIGLMAACLVGGFVGSTLYATLSCYYPIAGQPAVANCQPILARPLSALVTILTFIGVAVVLARIGWLLGKRYFREYPQPQATWGEHDDAPGPESVATEVADMAEDARDLGADTTSVGEENGCDQATTRPETTAPAPSNPAPSTPDIRPRDKHAES